MTSRIWGLDGSNPVTLKGHTSAVLGAGIIGRGKNVVTCSRDGTVKLWELASSSVVYTWDISSNAPIEKRGINCIAVGTIPEYLRQGADAANTSQATDPREHEIAEKLACIACDDGSLKILDLRTKQIAFSYTSKTIKAPLAACAFDNLTGLIATGSGDGFIELLDMRNLDAPLTVFKRNGSPITNL
ncbi:hypothetical protein HDV05_005269 [Chytridiales sp. JEL 0842]|nr:hypothetical protein HDV05_005269 [Chytridiales sp. JEL 0842]